MNGDKKAWWRRVSQAYSKQTKEWKENKAGIQKEQGGKTWYGGLELSHDDPKGEPLGFHGSLTLGAHVEGKICYIFGFEADAGWVWNWTGKNGWEKGKLFGKATPVKAVGGEVGAEANVYGEIRGGYKFAVLECPSTGKDNMATKGGSE
jgi:hypothetical protein